MHRHSTCLQFAKRALSFLARAGCCLLLPTAAPFCSGQIADPSHDTALAVFRRNYTATGGDQWKAHGELEVEGTLNLGGISGTYKQITDLRTGRDAVRLDAGPVHMKQVTLTDASWQLDQSGVVSYADTPDAKADAANASFVDRNGWFNVRRDQVRGLSTREDGGKQYFLVSVVPFGGREMTLWFGAEDSLLYRIDQLDSAHHQTSVRCSDYRKLDGVLLPFVQRQSSGGPDQDITETIRSARFSPQVKDANFQAPRSVFRDASLKDGQQKGEVPFGLADNRILLDVSINGHAPLPFLLDSGAANLLTPVGAKILGLEGNGNLPAVGVGKDVASSQLVSVKRVRVGPVVMSNQPFVITPLPRFLEDRGGERPIAGLLGAELLRRFPTTFDYQRKVLTFYKPGSTPPEPPGAQRQRLLLNGGHSFIELQVDGATGVFGIDTGDSGSVTLFSAFYRQHQFPIEQPTQPKLQGGVGGFQAAQLTRINSLALGGSVVKEPIVTLSTASQGLFSNGELAGNLGNEFLRRFVFTLDYEHRIAYFSEAADFAAPDRYNRSGLSLDRNEAGAVYASQVNQDTPSQNAGIRVGDVVMSIDGEDARSTARSRLSDLLSGDAGRLVSVTVLRDRKEQTIRFALAELLPLGGLLSPLVEKLSALPSDVASVTGTWACRGTFRGGKPHESTYAAMPVLNGTWLELTEHDTVPATGYDAKYLIGYDADHKRLTEFDANTFSAATYTSLEGWRDGTLTMSSEPSMKAAAPYRLNRFRYSVPSPGTLMIDWEISKSADSPEWVTADHLVCSRSE